MNATAWFESQRRRHVQFASDARRDGDLDASKEMQEVADQLQELIAAGRPLDQVGMWPQIRNRSLMLPWSPDPSVGSMLEYARSLVEFSEPAGDGQVLFDVRVLDDRGEMRLHESFRGQVKYAHPFHLLPLEDKSDLEEGEGR